MALRARKFLFLVIVCCAFFAGVAPCVAQDTDDPIRVVLLSPAPLDQGGFWNDYITFMDTAATSLGIELKIVGAKDRYEVVENGAHAMSGPQKPDYLVYIYQAQASLEVLAMAEKAGVKSFITNTDVFPGERHKAYFPRERFKQWIGHIFPDDKLASQHLSQKLLALAAERNMAASDGQFYMVGIGGSHDTTVSTDREEGLRIAVEENPKAVLMQYVMSNWDTVLAYEKSKLLLDRHPEAKIYWAASDDIATSIQTAMKECGVEPGKDALVGGIDWSPEGIKGVREGTMAASIGGHFMEGAWVLALIYDYHHGNDFADPDATMQSQMRLIDHANIETFLPILDRDNWGKIDFRRFTKTHNPQLKEYDFSPDAVVKEFGTQ